MSARIAGSPGGHRHGGDDGSAVVEFLGVALLLLVPVVYLVLVLGRVQAATFAVEGAAREAARAFVAAPGTSAAGERALAAVHLALRDQGFGDDAASALAVVCDPGCAEPGATVRVEVAVDVELPGVPGALQGAVPLRVPVSATTTATLDEFAVRS